MRHLLLGSAAIVLLSVLGPGDAQDKDKDTPFYKVTANELAEEFRKDAKEARKKYNPVPGGKGGARVEIKGPVKHVMGQLTKLVALETGSEMNVTLRTKKLNSPNRKGKGKDKGQRFMVEKATGTYTSFGASTVTISCDEVTLTLVEDKEK